MKRKMHLILNLIVWCYYFFTRPLFILSLHHRFLYPDLKKVVGNMIVFWSIAVIAGVLLGIISLNTQTVYKKRDWILSCIFLLINIIFYLMIHFYFGELYIYPMILSGFYITYVIKLPKLIKNIRNK